MKKPQKPRPTGPQMGGSASAPAPEQQSGGNSAQQGSDQPPVRYTDWASI